MLYAIILALAVCAGAIIGPAYVAVSAMSYHVAAHDAAIN